MEKFKLQPKHFALMAFTTLMLMLLVAALIGSQKSKELRSKAGSPDEYPCGQCGEQGCKTGYPVCNITTGQIRCVDSPICVPSLPPFPSLPIFPSGFPDEYPCGECGEQGCKTGYPVCNITTGQIRCIDSPICVPSLPPFPSLPPDFPSCNEFGGTCRVNVCNQGESDIPYPNVCKESQKCCVSLPPDRPTPTPRKPSITPPVKTPTPIPPSCPRKSQGDANCDGLVDGIDYSIWLNSQCPPTRPTNAVCSSYRADFNKDGNIDDKDYDIWLKGSRS